MQATLDSCLCPGVSRFAAHSGLLALALLCGVAGVGSASEPGQSDPKPASVFSQVAACGFANSETRVQLSLAGVPVIMQATPLPEGKQRRIIERRERLLRGRASMVGGCTKTQAYLQSILNRIVTGAGLEKWAGLTPSLEIVLECHASVPVPVARAMAGHVLVVPRALPLLAASEDALVAVLAHELAHFSLRHFERLDLAHSAAGAAFTAVELKKAHEREADITGLSILVSAGYDPQAALEHLLAVFSVHQSKGMRPRHRLHDATPLRVAQLQSQIETCGYAFSGRRTPIPPEVHAELRESLTAFAFALPVLQPLAPQP